MTDDPASWIGRRREAGDRLDPARARALLASLGRPAEIGVGDPLPPLFHWLYFWDVPAPSGTGPDGHPARGDFLPPIDAPRRMWAGGRLTFGAPLRLGQEVRRVSTITTLQTKSGRSGALTFLTLEHEVHGPQGLAVIEAQDLVYRAAAPLDGASAAPPGPAPAAEEPPSDWSVAVAADPILLFRYSALSMNSHRIHYDRPYAVDVEGYPDLVVQGPLQATLMLSAAAEAHGRPASGFQFRGLAPAFAGQTVTVAGRRDGAAMSVWASQAGRQTMTGVATFGGLQ